MSLGPIEILPEQSRGTRRPGPNLQWFTMLGVWVVVFLLVWTVVHPSQRTPLHDPGARPRAVTPRRDLDSDEKATIAVFRSASPSVVYITNIEYRRSVFSLDVFRIPQGTGSGFLFNNDGHIVTNYHVIAGASALEVTLADQSVWEARIVGYEPDKDIAVLKIDAPSDRLKPLLIGTSHDLQVGQKVFAIGNPFGFDQTLTTGVVSALGREIQSVTGRKIQDVIQTDAAINPGNSGGPLLDSAGRLIGVNTQIASPSGANAGISFAVPVDIVAEIVPDLIRFGHVIRPVLGINLFPDRQVRRLGLRGVLVDSIVGDSGAAKAGLRGTILDRRGYVRQLGDLIVKIGDQEVNDSNELKDALEQYKAGDVVRVTFIRDDRVASVDIELKIID